MKVRPKRSDLELMDKGVLHQHNSIDMQTIYHSANSRGHADHGWLNAKHSFSFASWYDPQKIHFGALRVLNDDIVAPGMGFGTHPHDNMEIITIPLEGQIQHQDSMGNSSVITAGEVQVMSAGTGVLHSEFNPSKTERLNLFQIWIFPNKRGVEPRYDQFRYDTNAMQNAFLQLVSPDPNDSGTWIHQDAWISITEISEGTALDYTMHKNENGCYIMVIEGAVDSCGHSLSNRDALGVSGCESFTLKAEQKSRLIVIEVPMQF